MMPDSHAIRARQRDQLRRAQKIDAQNLRSVAQNFENAFHGRESIAPYASVLDRTSPASNLLLELCKVSCCQLPNLAAQTLEAVQLRSLDGVEQLARLGGFDTRRVTLTGAWYKRESRVMFGFLAQSELPILLVFANNRYRYYAAETDRWHDLPEPLAKTITAEALLVYRRLDASVTNLKHLFAQGLSFVRPDLHRIALTATLLGASTLVMPVVLGKLLTTALPNFDFALLHSYLLGLAAAVLGGFVAQFFTHLASIRVETYLGVENHAAIWSRLLRLPMKFFDRYDLGDLASRANMFDQLQSVWTASAAQILCAFAALGFNLALLGYYHWQLALLVLALCALVFAVSWFGIRRNIGLCAEILDYRGKLDGIAFQLLRGIAKLRSAAKENTAVLLWSNLYNKLAVKQRRQMRTNDGVQVAVQLLPLGGSIAIFAVVWYGVVASGATAQFGLGEFIAINAAFGQMAGLVASLGSVLLNVASTIPAAQRLKPLLEQAVEGGAHQTALPDLRGSVRFSGVSFHYQPDQPILQNINLRVTEGEYVAIVGPSGSGKSTLFNLLLGFEAPTQGMIFVDSHNLNDLDRHDFRRRIGVVLQDGEVFPGSIYQNIACEDPRITLAIAQAAAEKVGLGEDLRHLPMGLHTLLSCFGGGLSGGQLQRIMLARAIAREPKLLLLDEATSALDNTTQRVVQQSLQSMQCTRIVIAHRLSSVICADCIYVLERGQIREHGSYAELLAKKGMFYELAKRQYPQCGD